MFKRILVALDGSHTADLGLDEAIKVAKDQDASLFLFHVVDEHSVVQYAGAGMGGVGGAGLEELLDKMREEGKLIVAKAEAKARDAGVPTESLVVEQLMGPISDLIIEQVNKWNADLIVLGTHGRRGIRRIVMGSDAEGVVRSTPVPILLVRSRHRTEQ